MADDTGNANDKVNDVDQHVSPNHSNTNCVHQTSHFHEFYILDVAKDPKRHKGAHAMGRQKKKDGKTFVCDKHVIGLLLPHLS